MTGEFETLQAAHQELLAALEQGPDPAELKPAVLDAIETMKSGSASIANPRDREQLRAILRFWAAYIYDHTGTYPDTTLRPADRSEEPAFEETPPRPPTRDADVRRGEPKQPVRDTVDIDPGPERRRTYLVLAGLAVGVLVVGAVCYSLFFFGRTGAGSIQQTQAAALTQPAQATNPPLPTPTEIEPEQGGSIARWVAATEAGGHSEGCAAREVLVTLDPQGQLDEEQVLAITVQVLEAGSGTIVAAGNPFPDEPPGMVFDLSEEGPETDAGYLLHIDDPGIPAQDVILQFSADCSRNLALVEYSLIEDAYEVGSEPKLTPGLSLGWELLTWGPAPDEKSWVATVRLAAEGGDGTFVFWVDGDPLADDRLILQAQPCRPGRAVVGVTSGGQSAQRELSLLSPFCP